MTVEIKGKTPHSICFIHLCAGQTELTEQILQSDSNLIALIIIISYSYINTEFKDFVLAATSISYKLQNSNSMMWI